MTSFPLKIVTPDGLIYDGPAEMVIVRTITGDYAFMAKHVNCVAPLGMGCATVIIDGKHDEIPESFFLYAGSIDEVVAKFKGGEGA